MDDPDDGCSWQAWKFGMKREDLHTKLQDQYNTLALPIQDPDAFQHDVCEISKTATDVHQFHQMLDERKRLRLDQLREGLQSAAVEIIANPKLIGTDQWQHAIQLFRTHSFDSLVRYFSSYLPEDHEWAGSPTDSGSRPFFDDIDDVTPMMTHEPMSFMADAIPSSHLPPSPRSLTTCSDSSGVSSPSRTLSFSEPESDVMALSTTFSQDYDDYTSQWDDEPDTPTTSISDISELETSQTLAGDKHDDPEPHREAHGSKYEEPNSSTASTVTASQSEETSLSESIEEEAPGAEGPETPTPSTNLPASLSTSQPSSTPSAVPLALARKYTPLQQRVRDVSPGLARVRRRSPEVGRIQKSVTDQTRSRPKLSKR